MQQSCLEMSILAPMLGMHSDFIKTMHPFYKLDIVYLFKLNVTEPLLEGLSQEGLTEASMIPLF